MNVLFLIALAVTPGELQSMIDAGDLDRASESLAEFSPSLRFRFEGQIAMKRAQPKAAAEAFERAVEAGDDTPELRLHLAHARLGAGEPRAALRALEQAPALASKLVAHALLEARARRALDDDGGAYAVLVRATENFPRAVQPALELMALAADSGLVTVMLREAQRLTTLEPDRDAVLAAAHLLYQDRRARPTLEVLAARFPKDADIQAHLAHAYVAAERPAAAARLFERAVELGGDYGFEAADQYRLAGRQRDAARMNARVTDEMRRRVQRIDILFDQGAYARVAALPLHDDPPSTVYRIAYANYAVGLYRRASELARQLADTPLEGAAQALLEAMGRSGATP